jgi:peptidyl-dipeptidase Dcp
MCDTMAKEPEAAEEFIKKMSEKAKIKAQKEMEELKQAFNLEELNSSDVSYYVRKYKQEHYSIDEEKLREYFEFEYVLSWLHGFVKDFF